jgi:hypothetical protein
MRTMKLAALAVAGALVAVAGVAAPAPAQIAPPPERVEIYTGMPYFEPGDDPAHWSAHRNVVESNRYEWLTRASPGFRAARIRQECGPITEPALYEQCVATFY